MSKNWVHYFCFQVLKSPFLQKTYEIDFRQVNENLLFRKVVYQVCLMYGYQRRVALDDAEFAYAVYTDASPTT